MQKKMKVPPAPAARLDLFLTFLELENNSALNPSCHGASGGPIRRLGVVTSPLSWCRSKNHPNIFFLNFKL